MSKSRLVALAALVAGGITTGSAFAGGWSDFAGAFPLYPCPDGWVGCVVEGAIVGPDMQKDGTGTPVPADLRVGWFDLKPTATFSPFTGLSAYTGKLPEPEPEPEPEPVASDGGQASSGGGDAVADAGVSGAVTRPSSGGAATGPSDGGSTASSGGSMTRPSDGGSTASSGGSMTRPSDGGSTASSGGSMVRPSSGGSDAGSSGGSMVRPSSGSTTSTTSSVRPSDAGSTGRTDGGSTASSGGSMVRPTGGSNDAVAEANPPAAINPSSAAARTPAPSDDKCDNLVRLEPAAMLGKLSDGQVGCLEGSYAAAAKQTDKDKVSRVLMTNAYSKGDKNEWARLIKRHLEEVDQSDPDLSYKYALFLSKGGASRAWGVIKWANVALESKHVWTGDTYTSRVNALYKLRAAAAQKLWKAAEEKHATAPSDQTKKDSEDARNQTKVFSREWYEYAKAAGKTSDANTALQLCVTAAGTNEYCEGK